MPDVIYVKLFDWNVPDYETPEILSLQKRFREWTKMNEIEEELNKKVISPSKAAELKIDISDPLNPKETFNIRDLIYGKKRKRSDSNNSAKVQRLLEL